MTSLTWPPEASAHFWPISLSSVSQVEPRGASVPSLIRTVACANGENRNVQATAMSSDRVFMASPSLVRKQVVGTREQPARATLGQDVDQPLVGHRVHVELEHLVEQLGEGRLVLLGHGHALGVADERRQPFILV